MNIVNIVNELITGFKQEFNHTPEIVVSSPGRLDFLNTHQDYKGLPVVSIGVNLRSYVAIKRVKGNSAVIVSFNMKSEGKPYRDEFRVDHVNLKEKGWFGNYLRAAILALKEKGLEVHGFEAAILSQVPIGGGLGSSAAFTVSFLGALNEAYGLGLSKKDIAELAYNAEHDIAGIPCGRLDQYGSAYGGVVKIETKPPYNVEELPMKEGIFVVLDSGIKHSTAEIHPRRQADINLGLKILLETPNIPSEVREKLSERYDKVLWESIREEDLLPYLKNLPKNPRKRILFTLREHRSTLLALEIIKGKIPSVEEAISILGNSFKKDVEEALKQSNPKLALIGVIMNQQHALLRDLYGLSLPELEKIRNAALKAGALGVKISGAGLGGSLIALTNSLEVAKKVLKASVEGGAKRGWIVEIDSGLRRES